MPPVVELRLEFDYGGAVYFAPRVIEILNSTLPVDGAKTPVEAAAALDALFDENYSAEADDSAEGFLWWFWTLMHDLSRQVPHNSPEAERLASTLQALHDLPTKSVKLGKSWGGGTLEQWRDMPFFGPSYREALDDDPGAGDEEGRKQRFLNLQSYAARAAGLGVIEVEGWCLWALWTLVEALEGSMTPVRGAPDEINDDPAAVQGYMVKSAAAWIIFAGNRLYGRDEEVVGASAGPLWRLCKEEIVKLKRKTKGADGFCPERWNLWKQRFARIRDADELEADVRSAAGCAFTAMEAAEKFHTPS
ncbi:uncharacterized protein [Lolium perenne]|uniref:uncharacterized protein n=1 Tax=Lolium perenne TaxID=4522 RepID=UPI0021EA47ED|nr:uncharacterized protein LOC127341310 [Lolium perenne]